MFGLDPVNYRQLKQVLTGFPLIDRAIIYGSRARGTERAGSDIDITLLGESLTLSNTVHPLSMAIDELYLPYSFDISIFEQLNHAGLIAQINSEGKTFYQKPLASQTTPNNNVKTWKSKSLGEICNMLDGFRKPVARKDRKPGKYPCYGASGIVDYIDSFTFDKRLVLVGEDGAKWESGEKTAFIADGKYWANNHVHVLEPHADILLDAWLVYYLMMLDLKKWATGLATPKLNQTQLKSIPIPLPPLSEQKRIVAELDPVFEQIDLAIAAAEKRLAEVESLQSSALQSELAGKAGWKNIELKEAVDVIAGQSPKGQNHNKESKGIPFYQGSENFGNRYIEPPAFWTTQITKLALPGDILMSVRAPVGKINIGTKEICIGSELAALRPTSKIERDFLYYCLLLSGKSLVDSAGTISNSINKGQIENIIIPLPPLPEQKCIAAKLDEIFENASLATQGIKHQLECYRTLKSAILANKFKAGSYE